MTTVMTTTPGDDIGDLARAARWAQLIVDAALPLDAPLPPVREDHVPATVQVIEEDRLQTRAEAYAQILAQLIEGGWRARPDDLMRLTRGLMPEMRDPA